jgi:hypothetical protein
VNVIYFVTYFLIVQLLDLSYMYAFVVFHLFVPILWLVSETVESASEKQRISNSVHFIY